MREPVTLPLHLQLRDHGVLGTLSPAGDARLDDDVAEELVERLAVQPQSAPVRLQVHVPPQLPNRGQIPAIIRQHYASLRERAEYRLKRTLRAGRLSLAVGILVLLVALGLAEAVSLLTTGGLAIVAEQGLTIVGWVALWRPLDLLLFERWVLRRDIALYKRMEQMEIEVLHG